MHPARETILATLADAKAPVSGDALADALGITRAAVWKHIRAMREAGIRIEALSGRGYRLLSDVLNATLLHRKLLALSSHHADRTLLVLGEVESTNSELMRLAAEGAEEGSVLIAERQTGGRGRLGREWFTFPEDSLALSILLRPAIAPEHVSQLPLVIAVGLFDALSRFAPGIRIKWPNDMLYNGAKVAGILTEMRAEPGRVQAVVAGIGLNLRAPESGWPDTITQRVGDLATAAGGTLPGRAEVAATLIDRIDAAFRDYIEGGFGPIRERWWAAHAASGGKVRVFDGRDYISGTAAALDNDGALLLEREDGSRQRIIAGDLEVMEGSHA